MNTILCLESHTDKHTVHSRCFMNIQTNPEDYKNITVLVQQRSISSILSGAHKFVFSSLMGHTVTLSTWGTTLSEHLNDLFVYVPEYEIYSGSLCRNSDNGASPDYYESLAGADTDYAYDWKSCNIHYKEIVRDYGMCAVLFNTVWDKMTSWQSSLKIKRNKFMNKLQLRKVSPTPWGFFFFFH